MNFLNKLFPFQSLFNINSDSLTAYWVVATIFIFLIYLFKLLRQAKRISSEFQKVGLDIDEYKISNSPVLKNAWNEYSSTFFDFKKMKKTYEQSIYFFSPSQLFHNSYNIKWLQSVPSVLVGVGILGTFVGLTVGISDFHTTNTTEIQNSITKLLAGMGTAFVSSIWGMGLSLIYSYIEKDKLHSVQSKNTAFCEALDKRYLVTKNEEMVLQLELQKKAIAEYFIYTDQDNNPVKPANVLRDLFIESQKQSLALQTFSTDLAIKIESGFENILSNQFQEKIVPILDDIKKELQNFSQNIKNPAGEMTQAVVQDLKNVMAKMIEEFKSTISGSAKQELENLVTVLSETSKGMVDMPSVLMNSTEEMKKLIEMLSNQMNEKVTELQIEQEILIDKQKENINLSDKAISELNNGISKISEMTNNVSSTLKQFYDLVELMSFTSDNIKTLTNNAIAHSNQLTESEQRLVNFTNTFMLKNESLISTINQTIVEVVRLSNDYIQKYAVIEQGLKNIFGQIQTGVNDFSRTIGDGVKQHLEIYTDALTASSESLSSSTAKLEDTLEDLVDQLDKINGIRR